MKLVDIGTNLLGRVPPRLAGAAERALKRLPSVRARLDRGYDKMLAGMAPALKPYRDRSVRRLPSAGLPRDEVLKEMEDLASREEGAWLEGFVSGTVYHGGGDHIEFLNRVYELNSQTNPLHSDLWPSVTKYEAEVVAMTAGMLGGDDVPTVCGVVTSGGTESILLAMKTQRDWARATRGIRRPEVVLPTTAHPAFDKAGECFGIRMRRVPVGGDFRADVATMARSITRNAIALVGSAPTFPHGVVDPIEALSELARRRGIGFHTDACMGGFVLPFARKLGAPVPPFDFRLPGVTSMSADTHKFGYAAKGTSVVLYRTPELRRHQYFVSTDWPGGLYCSPSLAGSRPGGLIAACWAAMMAIGEEGYLESTRRVLNTAATVREGVARIPELDLMGDGLWIVAFTSKQLDPYRVMDAMRARGWRLIGLQRPPGAHFCVTLRHTQPGVAERFVEDLEGAVAHVKQNPGEKGGMAPVYGMASQIPFRGMVGDFLERYMDLLYEP